MPSPRILVVEDETVVAMDIELSLKNLGYEVAVVNCGEEAVTKAEAQRPDLVLMDIRLGRGADGIETADSLRKRFGIPAIYLTANADDETIARARQTEPVGYLLKPFRDRELHATVQMALSRASSAQRLQEREDWHKAILHCLSDAVLTIERDQKVSFLNQAAEEMFDANAEGAVGKDCAELLPMEWRWRAEFLNRLSHSLDEGVTLEIGDLAPEQEGEEGHAYVGDSIAPILGPDGKVTGAAVVFRALRPEAEPSPVRRGQPRPRRRVARPGREDPLTGLPGRAQAEQALVQAVRRRARAFVAVISVDRFKTIQSRFGAEAADEVLLFMSLHLAQELSSCDRLFRWTGPSFLMLLERLHPLEDVRREIARLTTVKLGKLLHLKTRSALVVVSAVWTVLPVFTTESADELVAEIERCLPAEPDPTD
jgi:diguanylate cyclase (GGDEF)-like protein